MDWKPLYETQDSNETASCFDTALQKKKLAETAPLKVGGKCSYLRWFTKQINYV